MSGDQAPPSALQRQIICHGFGPRPDTVPLGHAAAEQLVEWSTAHHLTGVTLAAIEAEVVSLPTDMLTSLRTLHTDRLRAAIEIEAALLDVLDVLDTAHIDYRVIKGLPAAHLDYDDPGLRDFVDADILVPRSSLLDAVAALGAAGTRRSVASLAAWWERRFARAVELHTIGGLDVDLHAALAVGWFGVQLDHDRLFELPATTYDLGGKAVKAFPVEARLLVTCYAYVLSRGDKLRLVGDLTRQLLAPTTPWRRALDLAGDGAAVLVTAVSDAAEVVPALREHPLSSTAVHPSRAARRALDALQTRADPAQWGDDARSTLSALGLTSRLQFLCGLAFPPAASRLQRRRSLPQHLARGIRILTPRADRRRPDADEG